MATIDKVIKFWPRKVSTPTPLMNLLAVEFEMAGTDDQGIEKICDLIGDLGDERFQEGVEATTNYF
jgi:hypothetical protein